MGGGAASCTWGSLLATAEHTELSSKEQEEQAAANEGVSPSSPTGAQAHTRGEFSQVGQHSWVHPEHQASSNLGHVQSLDRGASQQLPETPSGRLHTGSRSLRSLKEALRSGSTAKLASPGVLVFRGLRWVGDLTHMMPAAAGTQVGSSSSLLHACNADVVLVCVQGSLRHPLWADRPW
jgi:hypothetical protein